MGFIKREDQLNLQRMNSVQSTVKCPPVVDDQNHVPRPMPGIRVHHHHHHQQQQQQQQQPPQQPPYMVDRNANNQEMGCNYPNPYGQRVSLFQSTSASDGTGPRGIPDLNLTVGEPVWMDSKQLFVNDRSAAVKRAIAAQARQRRKLICKDKSFNSSSKSRFSFR
jgi:hypothetical protein